MAHDPALAFAALAHPQRLAVLRVVMRAHPVARPAGEIAAELDLKPSTLSGYLAQLLQAGLVTQERRGTSLLYGAGIEGAQALSAAWLGDVCAGRGWPRDWVPARRVWNVLFLGHGNSGPTLAAEALLRDRAGTRIEAFSAGTKPREQGDAGLLAALAARGIASEDLWPKPLALWQGADAPRMDAVIALGRAAGTLDWPGLAHRALWRLGPAKDWAALLHDLDLRLAGLAALDPASTPPARLQAVLDQASEPARISA